jgi:hypothetical protein
MDEEERGEVQQENEEVHRPGPLFFAPSSLGRSSSRGRRRSSTSTKKQQQLDMKVAESIYKRSARHKRRSKARQSNTFKCGLLAGHVMAGAKVLVFRISNSHFGYYFILCVSSITLVLGPNWQERFSHSSGWYSVASELSSCFLLIKTPVLF